MKQFLSGIFTLIFLSVQAQVKLNWVVPPTPAYSEVSNFAGGLATVKQDNMQGVIDAQGQIVLPTKYIRVDLIEQENHLFMRIMDTTLASGMLEMIYTLTDRNGQRLVRYKYPPYPNFYKGKALVAYDELAAIIDLQGRIVKPVSYVLHTPIMEGAGAIAKNHEGLMGVVGENWDIAVPFEYDWVETFCKGGIVIVKKNEKYGAAKLYGEEIIPCAYNALRCSNVGLVATNQEGKQGLIDWQGKEILPFAYDFVSPQSLNLICAKKNNKMGVISAKNEILMPFAYERIMPLSEQAILTYANKEWRLVNMAGKSLSPKTYAEVQVWDNGLVLVATAKGLFGLIDATGKEIVAPTYKEIMEREFTHFDNLIALAKTDKWGFVDRAGKERIPCVYDKLAASVVLEGLMIAKKANKWGIIDTNGKEVVPFVYDEFDLKSIGEGALAAKKDEKWGFIDTKGNVVIPFVLDAPANGAMNRFSGGVVAVEYQGQWGVIRWK